MLFLILSKAVRVLGHFGKKFTFHPVSSAQWGPQLLREVAKLLPAR